MEIRFGVIGAGGISSHHIRVFEQIGNVRVVSVFDVSIEQAAKLASKTGAAIAASAEEVLDPEQIDAVLICSPQFARGNLEELAANRNIHLLVEKPLGLQIDEVQQKQRVIEQSGIIHAAGYCLRYLDTVKLAKQYLHNRKIHLVQVQRYGAAHPAKWWNQLAASGGFLVDAVTHQVDLVRYLIGEFHSVYANFGRNSIKDSNPEATIYDGGALTFTMKNGAVGTLTESCHSLHYNEAEIKIFGADFFLSLNKNGTQLTIFDESQHMTRISKQDAYYEQNKQFVEAVLRSSAEQILCNYGDAAKTLAFTLAANRSFIEQTSICLD